MENLKIEEKGLYELLDSKGEERLRQKKERMRNLLKIAKPDEALYREIMLALGYKKNKVQFLELAMILPYSRIVELRTQPRIEKALGYCAGFTTSKDDLPENFDFSLKMEKSVWSYEGVRPSNFPEERIKNISSFFSESCEKGLFDFFKQRIEKNYLQNIGRKTSVEIVNKIISFRGAGEKRRLEIFFNIILPFYNTYYKTCGEKRLVKFLNDIYSYHPPLSDNSITRAMKSQFLREKGEYRIINSVKRYMGLIQLYKETKKGPME
ncbi:MAG: DUF2851 family protein [Spirochaetota bacterium]